VARGERAGRLASATITGAVTRRYHGFLVAAQPAPLGRVVVLTDTEVDIEREDGSVMNLRENGWFLNFTLDMGLPSWRYEIDGIVIEQSMVKDSVSPTGASLRGSAPAQYAKTPVAAIGSAGNPCGSLRQSCRDSTASLANRNHAALRLIPAIRVDPHDRLLSQGAEDYALTWMKTWSKPQAMPASD
jgi:hypothetical protein